MVLNKPEPIINNPLVKTEIEIPLPSENQILIRINTCGVCHTDLHIAEGDLSLPKLPVIPGHQVVGTVEKTGSKVKNFKVNEKAGVPWLNSTCRNCFYCCNGLENLCDNAGFTGLTTNGGFAEYMVVNEDYAYHLPEEIPDENMAPFLCAGIIGYRAFKLCGIKDGMNLGLYGFGASAHITIQVANHLNCRVFVSTRDKKHIKLAEKLGAVWTGTHAEKPNELMDASIIFAPAGILVLKALKCLRKGGIVALAGIHMTPIPELKYSLIYGERSIKSVANFTKDDAKEFLEIATRIPVRTEVEVFPLKQANIALNLLKQSKIKGAAVLKVS